MGHSFRDDGVSLTFKNRIQLKTNYKQKIKLSMKAFKINSKSAIAVITASLSLSVKRKASVEERQHIIKNLQRIMFINLEKYGVHVLESNKFLFGGLMSIKAIEDTDDVQYIEEVEIDVEVIKPKTEVQEKIIDSISSFLEMMAEIRKGGDKEKKSDKPKSPKGNDFDIDKKDSASLSDLKVKADCECPFCTNEKMLKQSN